MRKWIAANEPQGVELLAGKAKVNPGTIRNALKGKRMYPDTIEKIAAVIGADPRDLAFAPKPEPKNKKKTA